MKLAKLQVFAGLTAAALFLVACKQASQTDLATAPPPIANLDGLAPGWNIIEPGGDTVCSDGSPYRFFVRPGATDKLMVYFQGGGACWSGETCDPDLKPTYYVNLENTDPAGYDGIFRFENPENPIREHSVVFVPYCTADVHLGDVLSRYEAPEVEGHAAHSFEIQHRGLVNADAVLDWTYAHFFKPAEIFVTGSSAGSIPSPYYAMRIAGQYPDARIVQLGDASGGYRMEDDGVHPHESWGTFDRLKKVPGFENIDSTSFEYTDLYIVASTQYPDIMFAQYDAAEDEAQKFYLSLGDQEPVSLLSLIEANQTDIRGGVRNFRSFIAGGELHTILYKAEFYTYQVDDILVRDWVASLLNGDEISDVRCNDCTRAEVTGGFIASR